MEVPHHRWHFQLEVPVDLFCEIPVSGVRFTTPPWRLRLLCPLYVSPFLSPHCQPSVAPMCLVEDGKITVPVGQSPLAAGCLVAPPRSWPFRVTHRAAIAHLDLNTGHQNSGSGSCHGFLFLGKKAVATATGDPNAGMCRAT